MEKSGEPCSGSKKQLKFEELQCDVSVEEDSRREWTFTLCDFDNSGKVTREDITSLLHAIYEVVDSSVSHSPTSTRRCESSSRWPLMGARARRASSSITPICRVPGPELRPSLPRSCEAGRSSSGPSSGSRVTAIWSSPAAPPLRG